MTMRCADEPGWPERSFTAVEADGDDWCCDDCGWCQLDFPRGCRELVMAATWHGIDALIEYLKVIKEAGLTLEGEITMRVDEVALEATRSTPAASSSP